MLNDATCFKKIFIITGYTDLRSGIDRLADTVRSYLGEDAIEPDTFYLFCGRRTDRIKGLVWENDGYLLLYKRLEAGKFHLGEGHLFSLPAGTEISGKSIVILTKRITGAIRLLSCFLI